MEDNDERCQYVDHEKGICYKDMPNWKQLKEEFVTGHVGTTPREVLLVCSAASIGVFLCLEIQQSVSFKRLEHVAGMEAAIVLIPMLLSQTRFLYSLGCPLLAIELALAIWLKYDRTKTNQKIIADNDSSAPQISEDSDHVQTKSQLNFLTAYRSTVSFMTFIAILAVDFKVFPRRFAKTETTGYGLMDIGASSFVISAGLVSAYARSGFGGNSKLRADQNIIRSIQQSLPLVVLGAVRLVLNKRIDYQEHVSEYGVHWNFFLTLAVVNILSTCFRQLKLGFMTLEILPWLCLVIYQVILRLGVQHFIEDAPRSYNHPSSINFFAFLDENSPFQKWVGDMLQTSCDLFYANREGLLGCVGYFCLHCISEEIARFCLWSDEFSSLKSADTRLSSEQTFESHICGRLAAMCVVLWKLHWIVSGIFGVPVSRRSTNLPFLTWSLAQNMTTLFLSCLVYTFAGDGSANLERIHRPNLPIFNAINRNGLIMFLIANILTGLVNKSINTLQTNDCLAVCILLVYLGSIAGVALLLDRYFNVTIGLRSLLSCMALFLV